MPQRINAPGAGRALQRQFVIAGAYVPILGDEIYGIQDVGDHEGRSPFADRRLGAQSQNSGAAGVGIFSSLLIRPGLGTIFVVEQIIVNAGATVEVQLRLLRPGDVALLTIVLATPLGCLNAPVAGSGFIPTLAATLTACNRNTVATGGLFGQVRFPANTHLAHQPPRGIVLRGDTVASATALILTNIADNAAINATVYGTEYAAPPQQIP